MKALESSNKTTPQTQIHVFGYDNISTITLNGQLTESTSTQTLADIIDLSTKLLHNDQTANCTVANGTQIPRNRGPLDTARVPKVEPQHLSLDEPESLEEPKRHQLQNRDMTRDAPKKTPPRSPGRVGMKVKSPLSSTIKYVPLLDKFSKSRFKYFCSDFDPNY
ncbi:unnamed protein product [Malus baccata var. baccata]